MSKLSISLLLILIFSIFIYCGSNDNAAETKTEAKSSENSDPYQQAEQERNAEYGYTPPDPVDTVYSEFMTAETVEPGSCAEVALKFATAFSDVDSSASYQYCNDTMQTVVRAFMISATQKAGMLKAKENGFKILKVRTFENPLDTTVTNACITAFFQNAEVEDCSFRLRQINGEWKITDFGSQKNLQ